MYITNVCFVDISCFLLNKTISKKLIYFFNNEFLWIIHRVHILNVNFHGNILCKVKTNHLVLGGFVFP